MSKQNVEVEHVVPSIYQYPLTQCRRKYSRHVNLILLECRLVFRRQENLLTVEHVTVSCDHLALTIVRAEHAGLKHGSSQSPPLWQATT